MPASPVPSTNRLIRATSPYLLQHAHNPVDWYEWGEDAFRKAREENRLVFLSVGYAACHWCHVMEHECFEDREVAEALNRHFVSIKVDREERPDIDELYMAYTQAANQGHGGWPMSVFLLPDQTPFYAGTYFPKDRFLAVVNGIAAAWANDRPRITRSAEGAREFLARWEAPREPASGVVTQEQIDDAAGRIAGYFDRSSGGMASGSNKFPPSTAMELLLRVYRRTRQGPLLDAVEVTLDQMARGGIYDHLGGGICRYSTDPEWLVPHFEKMLYDQALVSAIYLDAYQLTRERRWAEAAADIFRYVLADLTSPEGGFYSSRDADSEGMEGKYYLWTVEQLREALGPEDAALFGDFYDVSESGNWFERFGHAPPGPKNILRIRRPLEAFAKERGLHAGELRARLAACRDKLLAVRARRTPPGLDDKILTAWNGLMIASLAKGARVLDEPRYAEAAARAADFVLGRLRSEGRLLRTYRQGTARLPAYLEDYAFLVDGLLYLYEATFDRRWLSEAQSLTDIMIRHFHDENGGGPRRGGSRVAEDLPSAGVPPRRGSRCAGGGFFFTASDGETLLVRSKQAQDGAIPAGNSLAVNNLLRLSLLLNHKDYHATAEESIRLLSDELVRAPSAYEKLLCAADFYHDRVKEIAILGNPRLPETQALVRTVFERYLPNKVVVHASGPGEAADLPLLARKTLRDGKPTAYVCEGYNCKLPVTSPEALAEQLDARQTVQPGSAATD